MAALGDAEAAARFYVACLQLLEDEWAPTACLEDIIGLGPRRAEVLLTWMLDNATALSASALPAIGAFDEERGDAAGDAGGSARLTSAALEGLGALIGGGRMADDARERAFTTLLRHAEARDNEPYLLGVAEGPGTLEGSARGRVAREARRQAHLARRAPSVATRARRRLR